MQRRVWPECPTVIGHLVDKLTVWRARVERTAAEDCPTLDPYDQDELVRRANYQTANLESVIESLRSAAVCFAHVTESLGIGDLERPCRHGEFGDISLRDCLTLPLESVDDHPAQIDRAVRNV